MYVFVFAAALVSMFILGFMIGAMFSNWRSSY